MAAKRPPGPYPTPHASIVIPIPPTQMAWDGALLVPLYMSSRYRQELLQHLGAGPACSQTAVFGVTATLDDVEGNFSNYDGWLLITLFSKLATYVAHFGVRSCEVDTAQAVVLEDAIQAGIARGFVPTRTFAELPTDKRFFVIPNQLNSAMAIAIKMGIARNRRRPGGQDSSGVLFSLLGLNDIAFDDEPFVGKNKKENGIRILRLDLVQAPLLSSLGVFAQRIHRFITVYTEVLRSLNSKTRNDIDVYLTQAQGMPFEDLINVILPINSIWAGRRNFSENPIFNLSGMPRSQLRRNLKAFLDNNSLPPTLYTRRMRELCVEKGEHFHRSSNALLLFVRYPFIRTPVRTHLLLAPHFLLRNIELAVTNAFIRHRARNSHIQDLYGPLGKQFEKYMQRLLQKLYPGAGSQSVQSPLELNPRLSKGRELCDAIIDGPDVCVIFEMKFRPPRLDAIDMSDPSIANLADWLENTFLKAPQRTNKRRRTAGALWQLDVAAKAVLGGARGYSPKAIVPVVVISEDILFVKGLYDALEDEVRGRGLFAGVQGVVPFMVLSVSDLERLVELDLHRPSWTLPTILREWTCRYRDLNLPHLLKVLGLQVGDNPVWRQTIDELGRSAIAEFSSRGSGVRAL